MIKISTATALGILCAVTLHAASSSREDLPLTTLPAPLLGPTELQYELVTPPDSDSPKPSQVSKLITQGTTDLHREDFFGRIAILALPTPSQTAYFGLMSSLEAPDSILYDPPPRDDSRPSGLANDTLSGLAGVGIYGFGVFAIYRAIRKAGREGPTE